MYEYIIYMWFISEAKIISLVYIGMYCYVLLAMALTSHIYYYYFCAQANLKAKRLNLR